MASPQHLRKFLLGRHIGKIIMRLSLLYSSAPPPYFGIPSASAYSTPVFGPDNVPPIEGLSIQVPLTKDFKVKAAQPPTSAMSKPVLFDDKAITFSDAV